jgi:hypothetical protein
MLKTDELNLNLLNKIVIIIVFVKALSFGRAFSQPLISNGDFSLTSKCPQFWSQKSVDFVATHWWSPNQGTPDTYNPCSEMCGTFSNWMGGTLDKNNKGYVGLVIQSFNKNAETNYREYIQTELTSALKKDTKYRLSLKVYFPVKCQYLTTDFSALFSSEPTKSYSNGILSFGASMPFPFEIQNAEKGKWISLDFVFEAKGGERFLTLGNFLYSMTNATQSEGEFPLSYLFIDDVVLENVADDFKIEQPISPLIVSNKSPSKGLTYSVSSVFSLDEDVHSSKSENDHAFCSCVNCMRLRGELDKSIIKLESITDFEVAVGQRIDLNDLIFDVSTGALLPDSKLFLNRLIFFLTEIEHVDIRFVVYTYESNPNGENIAKETSLNLYQILRKSGIPNKISFLHDTKNSLSRLDGLPTDRSIEMHIVKINN